MDGDQTTRAEQLAAEYRARVRAKLLDRGYPEEGIDERVEAIMVQGEPLFFELAAVLWQAMQDAELAEATDEGNSGSKQP